MVAVRVPSDQSHCSIRDRIPLQNYAALFEIQMPRSSEPCRDRASVYRWFGDSAVPRPGTLCTRDCPETFYPESLRNLDIFDIRCLISLVPGLKTVERRKRTL